MKKNKTKQKTRTIIKSCLLFCYPGNFVNYNIGEIFSASMSENDKTKRHSSIQLVKKQTNDT